MGGGAFGIWCKNLWETLWNLKVKSNDVQTLVSPVLLFVSFRVFIFILSIYEFCWHHSKSLDWCFLTQPANTSLKDYGRFQKDGELKVLSHMDSRVRNRCVLPAIAPGFQNSFLLVCPSCCVFMCSRWGWFCSGLQLFLV